MIIRKKEKHGTKLDECKEMNIQREKGESIRERRRKGHA